MGYKSEFAALATAFKAGWVLTGGAARTPVAWPNVDFNPASSMAAWVRFNVVNGEAGLASIGVPGGNTRRHVGMIVVQVFVPLNTGAHIAREHADKVLDIFKNYALSGIRCRPGYAVDVGTSEADGWHQMNVTIPFTRDEVL